MGWYHKRLAKSIWVFHISASPCNNCDIEVLDLLTPRYDIERFGIKSVPRIIEVTDLRVSVSVQHVMVADDEVQTVYVYVADQHWNPIKGAGAVGVIRYPSGEHECVFNLTDEYGFTQYTFNLHSAPRGEKIVVDVRVAYGRLTDTAQTSFFPWW